MIINEVIVIHRCCLNNRNNVFVKNEILKYLTIKILMTTINEMRKMKLFLTKARRNLMKTKKILIKTIEINEKKTCPMTQAFFQKNELTRIIEIFDLFY